MWAFALAKERRNAKIRISFLTSRACQCSLFADAVVCSIAESRHSAEQSRSCSKSATCPDWSAASCRVASLNGINTTTWSELGRTVTVAVKGLRDCAKINGNDVRSLRLYLAGHVLPAQPTLISLSEEYVNFAGPSARLVRTSNGGSEYRPRCGSWSATSCVLRVT
jgi:hypothetical protein